MNKLFVKLGDVVLNIESIEAISYKDNNIYYNLKGDWNLYTIKGVGYNDFANACHRILAFEK